MPKEILLTQNIDYLATYQRQTPDELIKQAQRMKEDGVSSFRIIESYGNPEVEYYRLETEEEELIRFQREALENEQRLKNRAEFLKREAEALGFKLEKQ